MERLRIGIKKDELTVKDTHRSGCPNVVKRIDFVKSIIASEIKYRYKMYQIVTLDGYFEILSQKRGLKHG